MSLLSFPADYWRWYLLANAPESDDSNFTWEHFQATVTHELANVLGNFVNRIAKFCHARLGGVVPAGGEYGTLEAETTAALEQRLATLTAEMEAMEFRKSAIELRSMWVIGNEYLQKAEPWMKIKADPIAAGVSIRYALNLAMLFAALATPFIPHASAAVAQAIAGKTDPLPWPGKIEDSLEPGATIAVPDVLFAKIEPEQLTAWIERFGGADKTS